MKKRISPSTSLSTTKRTKPSNTTQGRWSYLPDDILVTIAELLVSPDGTDFARFRAVCKSCRSAASKVNFTLVRQMPWIMLPTTNNSRETQIFNPSESKLYNLPLPEARWITTCGSVKGWVATVCDDYSIDLWNLNPFTSHPRRISLPSLLETCSPCGLEYGRYVKKICLPSSPTEDPNGMAVAIYGTPAKLAFMRLGSRAWAPIGSSVWSSFSYHDVVFYRGSFYAVNSVGYVMKLDFQRQQAVKIASGTIMSAGLYYLVESAGDLLQVAESYETKLKKVFKLDLGRGEWKEVSSLGERSLFLGVYSYSISLHVAELFKCRSNCIYFINYHCGIIHSMAVYSLDEKKIIETQDMGQTDTESKLSPFWVSPFIYWQKSYISMGHSDISMGRSDTKSEI